MCRFGSVSGFMFNRPLKVERYSANSQKLWWFRKRRVSLSHLKQSCIQAVRGLSRESQKDDGGLNYHY